MKSKKADIKKLYLSGMSINDIAIRLGCSRHTVLYHKKNDLKNGIDWNEELTQLNHANLTSTDNKKQKKEFFFATLVNAFETEHKNIQAIDDPIARMEALKKYSESYIKLTAPKNNNYKSLAKDMINFLIPLILEEISKYDIKGVDKFIDKELENIELLALEHLKKLQDI
jgi:hypothetical protein